MDSKAPATTLVRSRAPEAPRSLRDAQRSVPARRLRFTPPASQPGRPPVEPSFLDSLRALGSEKIETLYKNHPEAFAAALAGLRETEPDLTPPELLRRLADGLEAIGVRPEKNVRLFAAGEQVKEDLELVCRAGELVRGAQEFSLPAAKYFNEELTRIVALTERAELGRELSLFHGQYLALEPARQLLTELIDRRPQRPAVQILTMIDAGIAAPPNPSQSPTDVKYDLIKLYDAKRLVEIGRAVTETYRLAEIKEPGLASRIHLGRLAKSLIEFVEGPRQLGSEGPAQAVLGLLTEKQAAATIEAAERWSRIDDTLALQGDISQPLKTHLSRQMIGRPALRDLTLKLLDSERNLADLQAGRRLLCPGEGFAGFLHEEATYIIGGEYPSPVETLIRAGRYAAEIKEAALMGGSYVGAVAKAIARSDNELSDGLILPSLAGQRSAAIVRHSLLEAARIDSEPVVTTLIEAFSRRQGATARAAGNFIINILAEIPGSSRHIIRYYRRHRPGRLDKLLMRKSDADKAQAAAKLIVFGWEDRLESPVPLTGAGLRETRAGLKRLLADAGSLNIKLSFDPCKVGLVYAGILEKFLDRRESREIAGFLFGSERARSQADLRRVMKLMQGEIYTSVGRDYKNMSRAEIAAEVLLYGLIMRRVNAIRPRAARIISVLKADAAVWTTLQELVKNGEPAAATDYLDKLLRAANSSAETDPYSQASLLAAKGQVNIPFTCF